MMAADSNKFPTGFIVFVSFSVLASMAFSPASAQTEEKAASQCTDGTYKHDGRDCCLCAAGLHLVNHCTTSLKYGQCDSCESGTYSSHPNDQMSCDRCTSCSHPSENLEEDEPCTPARDTKCRCKKDHYCSSGTETCKLCQPCKKCGDEGIKVACAGNNNTVCNDKTEGGNHVGAILSVIVIIALLIAVAVFVFLWWRHKRRRPQTEDQQSNGDVTDVEMQHLNVDDIQPHLPDIAEMIGWKDMKDIAIRSGIPYAVIESCKLDNPDNSQEQTLQLLRTWVERQGREASRKLIQNLHKSGKKGKAERVTDILSCGS